MGPAEIRDEILGGGGPTVILLITASCDAVQLIISYHTTRTQIGRVVLLEWLYHPQHVEATCGKVKSMSKEQSH